MRLFKSPLFITITALTAVALTAVITAGGSSILAQGSGKPDNAVVSIRGDVNCDGVFDGSDVLAILREVAGLSNDAGCSRSANVLCGGPPDVRDALAALFLLAGSENGPATCALTPSPVREETGTATPTTTPLPAPSEVATATNPTTYTPSPTPSPTVATITPTGSGDGTDSGIDGLVAEGPTCPVERAGSPCPDRPLAALIGITPIDGGSGITVESDDQGRFHVAVPSGQYNVQPLPVDGNHWPAPGPPQQVTVEEGQFVQVTVTYDTGIR
jgi:hypothetical protein